MEKMMRSTAASAANGMTGKADGHSPLPTAQIKSSFCKLTSRRTE